MKKLWTTAAAVLGVWVTFCTFPLMFTTSPWHLVFAVQFFLVFAYGTYKAIKAAYIEWTVPRS
jgi:hypothetical protein